MRREIAMSVHIVHVNAGNDRNGNPRRAYIVMRDVGGTHPSRSVYIEGYEGNGAIPPFDRDVNSHNGTWCTLQITPAEYKRLAAGATRPAS